MSGAVTPKRSIPLYNKGGSKNDSAKGEARTILRNSQRRHDDGDIGEDGVTPDNHESKLKSQFNMVSWNDFENLPTE